MTNATTETFSSSDIRYYAKEFRSVNGDAIRYLSKDMAEALLDAWIFRHLVLRISGRARLTESDIHEVTLKLHREVFP